MLLDGKRHIVFCVSFTTCLDTHFYSANLRCCRKSESLSKRFYGSEIVKQLINYTEGRFFIGISSLCWEDNIKVNFKRENMYGCGLDLPG
jgi:hypothetical protein